jgi:hypothetical protein
MSRQVTVLHNLVSVMKHICVNSVKYEMHILLTGVMA